MVAWHPRMKSNSLRGIFFHLASGFGGMFIGLGITSLATRQFSKAEIGEFLLFLLVLQIACVVSELGLRSQIVRDMGMADTQKSALGRGYVQILWVSAIIWGLVMAVLSVFVMPIFDISSTTATCLVINTFLVTLFQNYAAFYVADSKSLRISSINISTELLRGAAFLSLKNVLGAHSLVIAYTISRMVGSLIVVFDYRSFLALDKRYIQLSQLKRSSWLWGNSLLSVISARIFDMFTARTLGLEQLAVYGLSQQLAAIQQRVFEFVRQPLVQRATVSAQAASGQDLRKAANSRFLAMVTLFCILVSSPFTMAPELCLNIIYGKQYHNISALPLLLLSFSVIYGVANYALAIINIVENKNHLVLWNGIVNLLLAVLCISVATSSGPVNVVSVAKAAMATTMLLFSFSAIQVCRRGLIGFKSVCAIAALLVTYTVAMIWLWPMIKPALLIPSH